LRVAAERETIPEVAKKWWAEHDNFAIALFRFIENTPANGGMNIWHPGCVDRYTWKLA
jgi:hypothetical protein